MWLFHSSWNIFNWHGRVLTLVCTAFRLLYGTCTLSVTCTHFIKDVSVPRLFIEIKWIGDDFLFIKKVRISDQQCAKLVYSSALTFLSYTAVNKTNECKKFVIIAKTYCFMVPEKSAGLLACRNLKWQRFSWWEKVEQVQGRWWIMYKCVYALKLPREANYSMKSKMLK